MVYLLITSLQVRCHQHVSSHLKALSHLSRAAMVTPWPQLYLLHLLQRTISLVLWFLHFGCFLLQIDLYAIRMVMHWFVAITALIWQDYEFCHCISRQVHNLIYESREITRLKPLFCPWSQQNSYTIRPDGQSFEITCFMIVIYHKTPHTHTHNNRTIIAYNSREIKTKSTGQ